MARNISSSRADNDDHPAARRWDFERLLCEAISKRVLVNLRYKDDRHDRLVAPYAVYNSSKGKVLLACTQITNPEKPLDRWEPRNLEVGLMTSVALTDTQFKVDSRFDPFDARYQNGFICRVE